jgi:hypothetical protein
MPDDAPVTSASLPVRARGAAAAVGTVAAAVDDALTCSAVFCSIHRGNHDRGAAPAGLHGSAPVLTLRVCCPLLTEPIVSAGVAMEHR